MSSAFVAFRVDQAREDGLVEESINWEDDEHATAFTLGQLRLDGRLQFSGGAALIPTSKLEQICNFSGAEPSLSYERAALPDNRYHGNLLLSATTPKHVRRQIAGTLALAVSVVIPQPSRA